MFASSASVTVAAGSTSVAGSPSTYAVDPADVVTAGASLTGVTATLRDTGSLRLFAAPPASTWTVTVRGAAVGSSELLWYVIVRSAVWYSATDAVPVRVSTPVPEL